LRHNNKKNTLNKNYFLFLEVAVVKYEENSSIQKAKRDLLNAETIPFYLNKLDSMIYENNGYFALGKLTWADLYFASLLDYLNYMCNINLIEHHPNLRYNVEMVLSLEGIRNWIAKRPQTEF
jgi:glutathione S-transferase